MSGENKVVMLPSAESFRLSPEDLLLVERARVRMDAARVRLGSERERYLRLRRRAERELAALAAAYDRREEELYADVHEASAGYEQVIGALAPKYVSGAGTYNYRPDLGAFVTTAGGADPVQES